MTIPAKKLNNGVEIPLVGLGTWKAKGAEVKTAVRSALEAGYRHFDTAMIYDNEREVGEAIRESGIPREQIFITTKLWNADQGYDSAKRAFDLSRLKLAVDYIDLYLIHWPQTGTRQDSWRALEELCERGVCRAIGVSNYTVRHLEELKTYAKVTPAVNQVEFHPYLYQKELLEYCTGQGIALEAYSPLVHGARKDEPLIRAIATQHAVSDAQVLLRWNVQKGNIILPKSTNPERIEQNSEVFGFELSAEEILKIDGLNENLRTCWDPSDLV